MDFIILQLCQKREIAIIFFIDFHPCSYNVACRVLYLTLLRILALWMYVFKNAKKRIEEILEKKIRAPLRDVVRGSYFFSCLRTGLLRLLVSVPKTSSYLLFSLSLGSPGWWDYRICRLLFFNLLVYSCWSFKFSFDNCFIL